MSFSFKQNFLVVQVVTVGSYLCMKRNQLKIKGIKGLQLKTIDGKFWEYQNQNI